MKLDKLFWSKAKADILKYLVFRRQGISLRAFESELEWSFPAIKKQIAQLEKAWVVTIDKDNNKWSIYLTEGLGLYIKNLMLYMLKCDLMEYFDSYEMVVERHFRGKLFGKTLDMDLVVIHTESAQDFISTIKADIEEIFREYLIQHIVVWYMTSSEFDKRYRLADKFVLKLMKSVKEKENRPKE